MIVPEKYCIRCGKRLVFYNGKYIDTHRIKKTSYCSKTCSSSARSIGKNTFVLEGGNTYFLVKHNVNTVKCYVNAEDVDLLRDRYWWVTGAGYVQGKGKMDTKVILLHRLLLKFPIHRVDHIDRNPLNNRRDNLRLITNAGNVLNNGKDCVWWNKHARKWEAKVAKKYLGLFDNYLSASVSSHMEKDKRIKESIIKL